MKIEIDLNKLLMEANEEIELLPYFVKLELTRKGIPVNIDPTNVRDPDFTLNSGSMDYIINVETIMNTTQQHEFELELAEKATQERNDQIEQLKDSPVYDQALRQAEKFMRKNRREWKRLHQHAEDALFEHNKAQYVYAIKKMRDMLKQPYTEEMIDQLWRTSAQALEETFKAASLKYSNV